MNSKHYANVVIKKYKMANEQTNNLKTKFKKINNAGEKDEVCLTMQIWLGQTR